MVKAFFARLCGKVAWNSLCSISADLRVAGLEQFDVTGPMEMCWGLMGGLGVEMACIQVSSITSTEKGG